jgi:hypothetical protein
LLRKAIQVIIETKLYEVPYPGGPGKRVILRPAAEEEKTA